MKELRARLDTLTPREREVFGFMVSGMLNKQVALDLGITEKNHQGAQPSHPYLASPIPRLWRDLR